MKLCPWSDKRFFLKVLDVYWESQRSHFVSTEGENFVLNISQEFSGYWEEHMAQGRSFTFYPQTYA
jgi:hypothetical protein